MNYNRTVCLYELQELAMDKLQLTGQNLGRVFNSKLGHNGALSPTRWQYQSIV
jgi:hypothetical protein